MESFKIVLYLLAIATSFGCAMFLFRAYTRRWGRLLLWSALCFAGLTINNIVLFLDVIVLPDTDFRLVRLICALIGMLFLLYGFIWDSD